jgi:hypothetical protein
VSRRARRPRDSHPAARGGAVSRRPPWPPPTPVARRSSARLNGGRPRPAYPSTDPSRTPALFTATSNIGWYGPVTSDGSPSGTRPDTVRPARGSVPLNIVGVTPSGPRAADRPGPAAERRTPPHPASAADRPGPAAERRSPPRRSRRPTSRRPEPTAEVTCRGHVPRSRAEVTLTPEPPDCYDADLRS